MFPTVSNSLTFGSENPVADQSCAAQTNDDPQACCQWILEEIIEFHRDEPTRDRACSGEHRSIGAKADYPENQHPTW